MMINYLSKDNRIVSSLNADENKERKFYLILFAILFVATSFLLWEFIYNLCNMIGAIVSGTPSQAIVQLLRMLPVILSSFIFAYMSFYTYRAFIANSLEAKIKIWNINGNIVIGLGAIVFLYVVIGFIATKQYDAVFEGYFTKLFPFDMLILGAIISLFGVFSIKYSMFLKKKGNCLIIKENRGRTIIKFDRFFYGFSYLIGACGFAAVCYSPFVVNWSNGYIFFNIMLLLNYATSFAAIIIYRYIFVELKDELKNTATLHFGIIGTICNVVIFGLYLLSVQLQNEAPNLNAFGILPIEFTASFNAFMVIYGLNNIIVPLTVLIKGLVRNKK